MFPAYCRLAPTNSSDISKPFFAPPSSASICRRTSTRDGEGNWLLCKRIRGKKAGVDESRAESSHLVRQLCCSLTKMKMTNGVQTRFTCLPPLCFRPPGLLCSQPAGLTNPSDACLNTIKTETTKILQSSSV